MNILVVQFENVVIKNVNISLAYFEVYKVFLKYHFH